MNLTLLDFMALSPLWILLSGALLILLMESFTEKGQQNKTPFIAFGVVFLALVAVISSPASHNPLLTSWIRFDLLAKAFSMLFLSIGLGATLLAVPFLKQVNVSQGEYFFLLLAALFGLLLIGFSADFLILFLGLETLSVALYVLCGYVKKWRFTQEGSVKYFLVGSLASAVLLYGIALLYGATGTLNFSQLLATYHAIDTFPREMLFLCGIALISIGLAFKAALVPFHTWAPDVYEGSPTPVTAFMAVGTKAGAFAAFVLVFLSALPQFSPVWGHVMAIMTFPTLVYANSVAIRQVQLRRFFAYSGMAHAGYLMIPLIVGTPEAISALFFYLVIYCLSTLGCFAVLLNLETRSQGVFLEDLKGLFKRSPLLAGILTLCLLTLAGFPPTVGFVAKFYLFKLGFQAGYSVIVIFALLTAILSAFYYFRFIAIMYADDPEENTKIDFVWPFITVGLVSAIGLFLLSCYPSLVGIYSP